MWQVPSNIKRWKARGCFLHLKSNSDKCQSTWLCKIWNKKTKMCQCINVLKYRLQSYVIMHSELLVMLLDTMHFAIAHLTTTLLCNIQLRVSLICSCTGRYKAVPVMRPRKKQVTKLIFVTVKSMSMTKKKSYCDIA